MLILEMHKNTCVRVDAHYQDRRNDFAFNSTVTCMSGMEIKFRNEADEVPGIKHLRLDFHELIKEPLTCRILQSPRCTPLCVFHLAGRADPHFPLKWLWVWLFHLRLTSHLDDSRHLRAGLLLPPLLPFPQSSQSGSIETSQIPLPFHSKASKASHFLRVKAEFLVWPRSPKYLLLQVWSGDQQ